MNKISNSVIKVQLSSSIPKYKQIIRSVREALADNRIKRGQQLPSINQLCQQFSVSRETALAAYKELKSTGIIAASPGKGYYIATDELPPSHKIFLLFDELNAFKEVLYNAFKESLGDHGKVEIFFHHYNSKVFETLILENLGQYTSYVIMPIPDERLVPLLKHIPEDKLYLMDVGKELFGDQYPSVYQNFEKDIEEGLVAGLDLIRKYEKLILVFPDDITNPRGTITGFESFCRTNRICYEVIFTLADRKIQPGESYLVIYDKDLVYIVKEARAAGYQIGKDIGIISFNDTPLKEVVSEGITTISTDFRAMGQSMVDLLLNRKKTCVDNPSVFIKRASL